MDGTLYIVWMCSSTELEREKECIVSTRETLEPFETVLENAMIRVERWLQSGVSR